MKVSSYGLTTQRLKLIACAAMLIDHMGLILFNNLYWMRAIGRIAFPIFAFFVAEGCKYSRKPLKRLGVMLLLGVFCGACYLVALGKFDCNMFVTFALSICIIMAMDNAKSVFADKQSSVQNRLGAFILAGGIIPLVWLICDKTDPEYGFAGVMVPVLCSLPDTHSMVNAPKLLKRADRIEVKLLLLSLSFIWLRICFGAITWHAFLAIPLLLLYNGRLGDKNLKWFFYMFYPLHILILYGIDLII